MEDKLSTALVFCFWGLIAVVDAQFFDSSTRADADHFLDEIRESALAERLEAIPVGYQYALALELGRLDRAAIDPVDFIAHLENFLEVKNHFYDFLPQELETEYLLALRIRSEHTSRAGWAEEIQRRLAEPLAELEAEATEAAGVVLQWVDESITRLEPVGTYPLNLKGDLDPMSTLRGGHGNEIDVCILAVAALRSAGIPARLVYAPVLRGFDGGKLWVEYLSDYTDGTPEWSVWVADGPTDPDPDLHHAYLLQRFAQAFTYVVADPRAPVNITDRYTETVRLWTAPLPVSAPEFSGIPMVLSGGVLRPVMGRDIYNVEPGKPEAGLAPGEYYLASGGRGSSVALRRVELGAGDQGWYVFDLEAGRQYFEIAPDSPEFFPWNPWELDWR